MSEKSQPMLSDQVNKSDCAVDIVIRNGWILTLAPQREEYCPGYVAVKDGVIIDVGKDESQNLPYVSETVIDASHCLVLPGFVNTHTHAPMTLFRGYADDLNLHEWLFKHIFPAEAKFINRHSVYWGTKLAILEMLKNGITTFADGYFFAGIVAEAAAECGVRAVVGQGIIDFPTPDVPDPAQNIGVAEHFLEKYTETLPNIYASVFCHSPQTCKKETLVHAKKLANRFGATFQIHLSETISDVLGFRKAHGVRPTHYLSKLGILDEETLVAHAVWVVEEEIQVLAKSGCSVSHVISSNMKLASGIAPIGDFVEAGIPVGLGTDGCASNNRLDLLRDIDLAGKVHKVWKNDPTVMSADMLLQMITSCGARALCLDMSIGSIEVGKQADIITIDLDKPHLAPLYNPYSHLVYCAKGSDVRDVVVAGKVIMRKREIRTFDEKETMSNVRKISKLIGKY